LFFIIVGRPSISGRCCISSAGEWPCRGSPGGVHPHPSLLPSSSSHLTTPRGSSGSNGECGNGEGDGGAGDNSEFV